MHASASLFIDEGICSYVKKKKNETNKQHTIAVWLIVSGASLLQLIPRACQLLSGCSSLCQSVTFSCFYSVARLQLWDFSIHCFSLSPSGQMSVSLTCATCWEVRRRHIVLRDGRPSGIEQSSFWTPVGSFLVVFFFCQRDRRNKIHKSSFLFIGSVQFFNLTA